MCKKCKKAFRKDMTEYEEADEYCPNCDNQYVSLSVPHSGPMWPGSMLRGGREIVV